MQGPARRMLAVAICAGAVFTGTQADAATRWSYYSVSTTTNEFGKLIIETFARIKERTKGELDIQFINYGETPYNATNALEVIGGDLAQMTEWLPAYTSATYPVVGAPGLPFLFPTFADTLGAQKYADMFWSADIVDKEVGGILAKHGAAELAAYYVEPMNFYFKGKIAKLEDIAGKRIRTLGPETSMLVERLGATPVSMSAAEVYGALQRGGLDGIITSSGGVPSNKWIEQLHSSYAVNMLMVKIAMIANKKAVDALDPAVRAILVEEMDKLDAALRIKLAETDSMHNKTMKDAGITFTSAEGADYAKLRDLSKEVWAKWAKDKSQQPALDAVLAVVAK